MPKKHAGRKEGKVEIIKVPLSSFNKLALTGASGYLRIWGVHVLSELFFNGCYFYGLRIPC